MSDGSNYVVILVTAPDDQIAASIGRQLVKERLVACANVIPGLSSIYWWEGEVEEASEVLVMLKAREADVARIAKRVRKLHPYSVPEVIAAPIVGGSSDYLSWIHSETERPDADG